MARGSKPGERRGGRQKGTPNKASAAREAAIRKSGLTPLDYMLKLMRNRKLDQDTRLEAAKAAAPYVHPKLNSVEFTGPNGGPVQVEEVRRTIVDPRQRA
jgi:hypothetical protein